PRVRADIAFDRCRIQIESIFLDVGEYRDGVPYQDCSGRGAHGPRADDDLVAGFDANRTDRSDQPGGVGIHRHRVTYSEVLFPGALKRLDVFAAEEIRVPFAEVAR